MGLEEPHENLRNGGGLSEPWAETAVRPRTTERHLQVNKRLLLGFAVSIVALILVSGLAVALGVRFEECSGRDPAAAAESGPRGPKMNANKGERAAEEEPWRSSRLPTSLRPRHYDLQLLVHMDNFTFSGDVSVELECVNATRYIVLHADRLEVSRLVPPSPPQYYDSPITACTNTALNIGTQNKTRSEVSQRCLTLYLKNSLNTRCFEHNSMCFRQH